MTQVTQVTHSNTGPGNTLVRSRGWVFTLNNYVKDDIENLTQKFMTHSYVFQEETGKNGTKHLQGCVKFSNARTFKSVKKLISDRCHLEKCNHWIESTKYCSKLETRTGLVYTNLRLGSAKDPLVSREPNSLQKHILDIHNSEPDDRSIYWYCDLKGNTGKTTLAKHLCINYKSEVLYLSGKSADCKFGITGFVKNEKNNLKTVIFDFTRSQEDYISYEALESIKNGIFFNTKYESEMIVYDCPHVIVLANFMPNMDALSEDRWKIFEISATGDVLEFGELNDELDLNIGAENTEISS